MILEKNNLHTAQEGTKSWIELIASCVHPKNSNHLRSHLRAMMALDHRRLIRPGKEIRPNFFAFDKFSFLRYCHATQIEHLTKFERERMFYESNESNESMSQI